MPPEKYITANGHEICYYEKGEGDAIFLLHGWPQTSYVWRMVIPELSQKFRVIAIDLPGLGKSGTATSYDTRNIAKTLNGFASKLKIKKFHLVEHDVGSWVAIAYAFNYEDHLKTLTIGHSMKVLNKIRNLKQHLTFPY